MSFRRSVLDSKYIFEYDVGLWTFGAIQVLRESKTNELRICKTVQKNMVRNPAEAMTRLQRMKDLQHKHICSITDVLEDNSRFYVICDMCMGGDVAEWIVRVQDEGNWLQEHTVVDYIRQSLMALVHAHGSRVCHRDLRPSSLLLTSKMPDAKVKIVDFGLAEVFDPAGEIRKEVSPFAAPEVLEIVRGVPADAARLPLGPAADIWSIGAIAHQLLVGAPPPSVDDDTTVFGALARAGTKALASVGQEHDAWSDRSPLSHDFVRAMLQPRATDRPTAAQALQHPWIQACVPLDPVHWNTKTEAVSELQNQLLCYLIGVLLLPDSLQHRDVFQLRSAFASMDTDRDGFISIATAQRLMRDRLPGVQPGDITSLFEATNVMGTGAVDLCTFLAAHVIGQKFGSPEGETRAQKTAWWAKRLVRSVFESYGDAQRMVVDVAAIQARLSSPVVREVEQHCGVRYDEFLSGFPEESAFDAEVLMSTLLESMGRGTPLAPPDSDNEGNDEDAAWTDRFKLDSLQDLVKGMFQTCVLNSDGPSTLRKKGRLGGM